MRAAFGLLTLGLGTLLQGCTSVPEASQGFLTRVDTLDEAKGVRGKRLQTTAPSPAIITGSKLVIEPPIYVSGADVSGQITNPERALILNALARSACATLSSQFDVVDNTSSEISAYRLRMGVSRMTATGRVGAAIGTLTGMTNPVSGVRPPFGLGGLTVELELVGPDNTQTAAMIWSRSADMVTSDAAASRIGDAYNFASDATEDFAQLLSTQNRARNAIAAVGRSFGGTSDPSCEVYGRQASTIVGLINMLGVPLPPERTDKGPTPEPPKP
jgi:hypothetical protein